MTREREPAYGLITVVCWLAVLWVVWLSDAILTFYYGIPSAGIPPQHPGALEGGYLPSQYGLMPRQVHGLIGIVTAPLLHGGSAHLLANTLALGPLLWISLKAYNWLTWVAVVYAMLVGGILTWFIASPASIHIGASGVIFGLLGFLMLNGLLRRGCLPLLIAIAIFLLYGGTLWQVLPHHVDQAVSWQMHLGGLVGGCLASVHVRHERETKPE